MREEDSSELNCEGEPICTVFDILRVAGWRVAEVFVLKIRV